MAAKREVVCCSGGCFHQLVPIDLVGVDPVECGRVGEELEDERHGHVPQPHLDGMSHDLRLTRLAPMLDHALDARSTETLIGRKGERVILSVSQALCQDESILY